MSNVTKNKTGFALAEIMVALFVTTMAIVLVGGLTQQVINMNKSSKQIAAVIEMRTKIAALSKDSDAFVNKMRTTFPDPSAPALESCIPSVIHPASTFDCPAVMSAAELLSNNFSPEDTENGRYKVSKIDIYDPRGEKIAPRHLTDNGSDCTLADPNTNCPFMSEGFLFRENSAGNPGAVKFVSRVSMNPGYKKNNTTPIKPVLMSVDLGTAWSKSSNSPGQACSNNQVFQGIETNGSARCVDPTKPCPAGLIQVGYDASGPLCEDPALLSCLTTEKPILDPVGKKLVCSSSSPCTDTGKTFTGLYAGTGEPICENPTTKCSSGSVQMGQKSDGTPDCYAVTTCSGGKTLSFDGTAFTCVNAGRDLSNIGCPSGKVLIGFDSKGDPDCVPGPSAPSKDECLSNQYMIGQNPDGTPKCKLLPESCPAGHVLMEKEEGTGNECISLSDLFAEINCPAGSFLTGWDLNGKVCSTPNTSGSLPPIIGVSLARVKGICTTSTLSERNNKCDAKCDSMYYDTGTQASCASGTIHCQCTNPRTDLKTRPAITVDTLLSGACDKHDASVKTLACTTACTAQTYSKATAQSCSTITTLSFTKKAKISCKCED